MAVPFGQVPPQGKDPVKTPVQQPQQKVATPIQPPQPQQKAAPPAQPPVPKQKQDKLTQLIQKFINNIHNIDDEESLLLVQYLISSELQERNFLNSGVMIALYKRIKRLETRLKISQPASEKSEEWLPWDEE